MIKVPTGMLTLADVADRLRLPYQRLYRTVVEGKLRPDRKSGRLMLFDRENLGAVVIALKANLTLAEFTSIMDSGVLAGPLASAVIYRFARTREALLTS